MEKSHLPRLNAANAKGPHPANSQSELTLQIHEVGYLERNFIELTARMNQAIYIYNADLTHLFFISEGYEKIWGRSCDSLYRDPLSFLEGIHSEDLEKVNQALASIVHGIFEECEYRVSKPDGSVVWVLDRTFPLANQFGQIDRVIGIAEDITLRKQAEEQAHQSEIRFQLAVRAASELIWDYDLEKDTFFMSENFESLTGYSAKEIAETREKFSEWYLRQVHPDDREKIVSSIKKITQEHVKFSECAYSLRKKDGTYLALWDRCYITYSESGKPKRITGASTDITPLKKTQKQLEEAIQARDEFISLASHELKTPLTSLLLQVGLSKRLLIQSPASFCTPEQISKLVENLNRQINRLSRAVEDMLDISRIVNGKLCLDAEEADLGHLVQDVMSQFADQLKDAKYTYRITAENSVIGIWDPYRIEQVLANLITNAIKYGLSKPIEISVLKQDKKAIFRISDQGGGIPDTQLETIFLRFERASCTRSINGLGLGLYISRQIVEAHHGKIWAESVVGRGSTFVMELPLVL